MRKNISSATLLSLSLLPIFSGSAVLAGDHPCDKSSDPLTCAAVASLDLPLQLTMPVIGSGNSPCPGTQQPMPVASAPRPTGIKKLYLELEPKLAKWIAVHAQNTEVGQGHFAFRDPYDGAQSMEGKHADGEATGDLTGYVGLRLWKGAEAWISPGVYVGYGLSNSYGVAGFPSGEAFKVGATDPYFRVQRVFLRQTLNLGGEKQKVDGAQNQMEGTQTANRLVFTCGKFAVTDVFDNNKYAHDPTSDVLNWTLMDAGSFDFAADSWGFTIGCSGEGYLGPFAARTGVFATSTVPNSTVIDTSGKQRQVIGELEYDYTLFGRPGKFRTLFFDTYANMGKYTDAVAQAQKAGQPANTANVRRPQNAMGGHVNVEQSFTDSLGGYLRAGCRSPNEEEFDFTDDTCSVSVGLALTGKLWNRPDDTFRLGGVVNTLSKEGVQYFNAGGMGIVIGDGKLPHPAPEGVVETSYTIQWAKCLNGTLDFQLVDNPAFNSDRGPIPIPGIRIHGCF